MMSASSMAHLVLRPVEAQSRLIVAHRDAVVRSVTFHHPPRTLHKVSPAIATQGAEDSGRQTAMNVQLSRGDVRGRDTGPTCVRHFLRSSLTVRHYYGTGHRGQRAPDGDECAAQP